jgi:hypothetical protein
MNSQKRDNEMTNPVASASHRTATLISSKLEKNLAAYIAAAGAAGVGVLALAQAAEAKVVYTVTNVTVTNPVLIDLNNDGVPDFSLGFAPGYEHSFFVDVTPEVRGNAVRGNGSAACGFLGVPVGPGEKFIWNSYFGHGVRMAGFFGYGISTSFGPWANVTNRYLGFKFLIDGQIHYGWARVSVTNEIRNVVLTGYAYETTPNTTIIEGHTSGPEKVSSIVPDDLLAPASQPASLGLLARGSDGISIWRRENDVGKQTGPTN